MYADYFKMISFHHLYTILVYFSLQLCHCVSEL